MPQIINTNIASLNSQRNLNKSQSDLGVSLQRLSSGLRINSAKDDAAGLAISERFTTQIRGINQAVRNSNDGISLAQTAEGDLAQITNNLQRIRELAVQSANATNSASDRAALKLESDQLIAEIDRVASTSAFNGVKLLDGNFSSQQFQVGANAGETVSIDSIASARTSTLGLNSTASVTGTTVGAADLTAGQLTINGTDVGAVAADAATIATAISATDTSITATATNSQDITFADVVGTEAVAATPGSTTAAGVHTSSISNAIGQEYTLSVAGTTIFTQTTTATTETVADTDIDAAIAALDTNTDGIIDSTAGSANEISYTGSAQTDDLVFTTADGNDFDVVVTNTFAGTAGGFAGADFATGTNTITSGTPAVPEVDPDYTLSIDGTAVDFSAAYATGATITAAEAATAISAAIGTTDYTVSETGGVITIAKNDGSNITTVEAGTDSNGDVGSATLRGTISVTSSGADLVIAGTSPGAAGLTADTTAAADTAGTGVSSIDISTVDGANTALSIADRALTAINSSRASLGAIQNRFESVVSSLSTSVENLSAARSRIRDADFAQETAALTRNQILQQAGVSILSQANALPQLALSLLQ